MKKVIIKWATLDNDGVLTIKTAFGDESEDTQRMNLADPIFIDAMTKLGWSNKPNLFTEKDAAHLIAQLEGENKTLKEKDDLS